jgi:peptidoglycan/xylan/chitin deacetylase (PgdA/CDA1 family)
MALASISVDLDSLPQYCRIHGLDEAMLDERARRLVYQVAIPRYLELFAAMGVKSTFFAVGEDLRDEENARSLRRAHASGVEIGNHSLTHDYSLSRRPRSEIDNEVAGGEEAIIAAVGERPLGFRAPGYTLSAELYRALSDRHYAYDSSAFPATPYYAAKALVLGASRAFGRRSSAILDTPRVLLAPRQPYHPDPSNPYARGSGGVLELPIATAPFSRLPFIGTFAATLPAAPVRATYLSLRREPHFNFELHGIDLLDASDGIPGALADRQRDVRLMARTKISRLRSVLRWILHDFEVLTLLAAARRLA